MRLVFRFSFDNGTENFALVDGRVYLITNLTGMNPLPATTNATGHVVFEFVAPTGNYTGILLTLEYNGEKYGVAEGSDAFAMQVEPVQIGIYSASMSRKDLGFYTFATIQSIYKKPKLFAHFKMVIIDECHLVNPKNFNGMFTTFLKTDLNLVCH